jgi:hypothetical protein
VSADGNAIVSADLNMGEQAYIDFEVKQGQNSLTNADLVGTYTLVTYGSSGDSGSLWTLTADGSGNFVGLEVQNTAGVITPSRPVTGTYAVGADGVLTVTPDTGPPLSGGVSADGDTLVLSQLTSGQKPSITVGIKPAQSGLTIQDVLGTYAIARQESSGDKGSLLTLTFDGAGNISGTGRSNDTGTISDVMPAGTYSVGADGTLTVSLTGEKPLTGSVSVDGKQLVLASLTAGESPSIGVGVLSVETGPWDYQ